MEDLPDCAAWLTLVLNYPIPYSTPFDEEDFIKVLESFGVSLDEIPNIQQSPVRRSLILHRCQDMILQSDGLPGCVKVKFLQMALSYFSDLGTDYLGSRMYHATLVEADPTEIFNEIRSSIVLGDSFTASVERADCFSARTKESLLDLAKNLSDH